MDSLEVSKEQVEKRWSRYQHVLEVQQMLADSFVLTASLEELFCQEVTSAWVPCSNPGKVPMCCKRCVMRASFGQTWCLRFRGEAGAEGGARHTTHEAETTFGHLHLQLHGQITEAAFKVQFKGASLQ